jgi:gluconolactonase
MPGKEGGYLLFSDINASKRLKYTPGQGVSVFKENTNQANGLTRDLQGRLVACEHETRRVTRQEHDGSITVIANSFQGRRLSPCRRARSISPPAPRAPPLRAPHSLYLDAA